MSLLPPKIFQRGLIETHSHLLKDQAPRNAPNCFKETLKILNLQVERSNKKEHFIPLEVPQ
jgi:hypothetical protein